jgi:hypothetical protein
MSGKPLSDDKLKLKHLKVIERIKKQRNYRLLRKPYILLQRKAKKLEVELKKEELYQKYLDAKNKDVFFAIHLKTKLDLVNCNF